MKTAFSSQKFFALLKILCLLTFLLSLSCLHTFLKMDQRQRMAELILSEKGKPVALFDGYAYNWKYERKRLGGNYFQCAK
jgi:hypothetical protein